MALEKLIVRVESDINGLKQKLGEAGVAIDQFSSMVGGKLSKIEGVFAGLGRALAVAGISVGIAEISRATLDAVGALADLNDQAERLGLSSEKLQELGLAALQNGSDIERMNDSLEQFTRRLGEAQAGSGGLLDVLAQYGVAVKNAEGQNLSTIEVLNAVADVMASVTDRTEQARIASEAFGKSGLELVPLLSQGSDAIRKMGDEAKAEGLILDEELINKAAEFDDAWKIATYEAGLHFKRFAINAIDDTAGIFAEISKFSDTMSDGVDRMLNGYKVKTFEAEGQYERLPNGGLRKVKKQSSNIPPPPPVPVAAPNLLATANSEGNSNGTTKGSQSNLAIFNKQIDAYKNLIDNLKFEAEQLGRTSTEQEIYNNLKSAGVSAASKEGQEIARLTKAYADQRDQMAATAEASQAMSQTVTDSLNAMILGTESLGSSLKNIALQIANAALTKSVTGPAGDFFGDALSSLFKFENGGVMTSRGSLPLRAYSSGGVASSPQLALYGEGRMPEAYVPLPDGRSIPVTVSGGAGGAVQIVQNINIAPSIEQTTRAEVLRMMPQIRQMTLSAVDDAQKRGKLRS